MVGFRSGLGCFQVQVQVWFGFGFGFELMFMFWFEFMLGPSPSVSLSLGQESRPLSRAAPQLQRVWSSGWDQDQEDPASILLGRKGFAVGAGLSQGADRKSVV